MNITLENMHDFPIGSVLEMNWGAMYPTAEAVVIKHEILPATKFFPVICRLVVEFENSEGEKEITTITRIDEKGIGARLIKLADKPKLKKSPWAD